MRSGPRPSAPLAVVYYLLERNRQVERRQFFGSALAGGMMGASQLPAQTSVPAPEVVIEQTVSGTPHQGKVLALITPHLDDGPFFAGGTVAKLLKEGSS